MNELWGDKEATEPAVSRLRSAVEELRPAAKRALKLRLNRPLSQEERVASGQDEWETAAERAVRAFLADGDFTAAARYLAERQERLQDSRLPLVEVEVYSGLQDWKRVIDIALPAAAAAADRGIPRDAFALFFAASRACEAVGDVPGALKALDSAESQARQSVDTESLLRVAATRMRLATQSSAPLETIESQEEVVKDLRSSGVLERLSGAALREVAAALGGYDPGLIRAALYRLGLPQVTPQMISQLTSLVSDITAGDSNQARAAREVFRSLRPNQVTEQPMAPEQWQAVLTDIPGLHLGRAVAELIGRRSDDPALTLWAQDALKARVQRDVVGDSTSQIVV